MDDVSEALCSYLDGDWAQDTSCVDEPCGNLSGRACQIFQIDDTTYGANCSTMTFSEYQDHIANGDYKPDELNWTWQADCSGTPDCELGHCCYTYMGTTQCAITVESRCDDLGGSWDAGAVHGDVDCDSHGRCCDNTDSQWCKVTPEKDCLGPNLIWIWGADCESPTSSCDFGHCCYLDDNYLATCAITLEPFCEQLDGVWDEGFTCKDVDCMSHGRCCRFDVDGTILDCKVCDWADCEPVYERAFWSWLDDCDGSPACEVLGACCTIEEGEVVCDQFPEDVCDYIGGQWNPLVRCLEKTACPSAGSCCYINQGVSVCEVLFQVNCANLAGTWADGGDCSGASPCPPVGACCHIDGEALQCQSLFEADCSVMGGRWFSGESCGASPCPSVGACCVVQAGASACDFSFQDDCDTLNGVFFDGATCTQTQCPAMGTCYYVNSSGVVDCEIRYDTQCAGVTELFDGDHSTCPPRGTEPAIGRCEYDYLAGQSGGDVKRCITTFEATCLSLSGDWELDGQCQFPGGLGYYVRVDANAPSSDVGFVDAGDPGNCWSIPNGTYLQLSDALNDINSISIDGEPAYILVAEGVYRPAPAADPEDATFRVGPGIRILGGYAGATWTDALCDERKPDVFRTILSGDVLKNDNGEDYESDPNYADNSRHVVTFDSPISGKYAALDGLYVQSGVAAGSASTSGVNGGGILVKCNHEVRLSNIVLRYNFASEAGGGAALVDGDLYFDGCRLEFNRAKTGAGLSMLGIAGQNANLFARACRFESNIAWDTGGALSGIGAGNAHVMNSIFRFNNADNRLGDGSGSGDGGAIYGVSANEDGVLTLGNCLFHDNCAIGLDFQGDAPIESADLGLGGAMFLEDVDTAITNCTVARNRSTAAYANGGDGVGSQDAAGIVISSVIPEHLVKIDNSVLADNWSFNRADPSEYAYGVTALVNQLDCGGTGDCFGATPMVDMNYSFVHGSIANDVNSPGAVPTPPGEGNADPNSLWGPFAAQDTIHSEFRLLPDWPIDRVGDPSRVPVVYGDWIDGEWTAGRSVPVALEGHPRIAKLDLAPDQCTFEWIDSCDIGAFQTGDTCCGSSVDCLFVEDQNDCNQYVQGPQGCDGSLGFPAFNNRGTCHQNFYANPLEFENTHLSSNSNTGDYYPCDGGGCSLSTIDICYQAGSASCFDCQDSYSLCESCFFASEGTPGEPCELGECIGSGPSRVPKFCLGDDAYFRAAVCDPDMVVDVCEANGVFDPSMNEGLYVSDRMYIEAIVETPDGRVMMPIRSVLNPPFGPGNMPEFPLVTDIVGKYTLTVNVADAAFVPGIGKLTDDPDRQRIYSYEVTGDTSDTAAPCDYTEVPCCDTETSDLCTLDCNGNGVLDYVEIYYNAELDQNANCVLDTCEPSCGKVDVVVIFDTTGSMNGEAAAICESLGALLDALEQNGLDNVQVTIMPVFDEDPGVVNAIETPAFFDEETGCMSLGELGNVVIGEAAATRYAGTYVEGNCCGETIPPPRHSGDDPSFPNLHLADAHAYQHWGLASILVASDEYSSGGEPIWRPDAQLKIIVPISDDFPCGGTEVPGAYGEFFDCGCEALEDLLPPHQFGCTQVNDGDYREFNIGDLPEAMADEWVVTHISVAKQLVEVAKQNNVIVSPIISSHFAITPDEPIPDWYNPCVDSNWLIGNCLLRLAQYISNGTGGVTVPYYDNQAHDLLGLPNDVNPPLDAIENMIRQACAQNPVPCNFVPGVTVAAISPSGLQQGLTEPYTVTDCDSVSLLAENQTIPGDVAAAYWDVDADEVVDFTAVEVHDEQVATLISMFGEGDHVVSLRIVDGEGCSRETTFHLVLEDIPPTVGISGPVLLEAGQMGNYVTTASTFCDDVVSVSWLYTPDDAEHSAYVVPSASSWPAGAEVETGFEWSGNLAVTITDSDGAIATATQHVTVTNSSEVEGFRNTDTGLSVIAENHAYEIDGDVVVHSAEMYLINNGPTALHGEIYVAFQNRSPLSTTIDEDETPGGSPVDVAPSVRFLDAGAYLASGASTERKTIHWRIPIDEATGPFTYDAVPYLRQQGPVITTDPDDGEVNTDPNVEAEFRVTVGEGAQYYYNVDAYDLDGDTLHYSLASGSQGGSLPEGMGIDSVTGELRWTPGEDAAGAGDVDGAWLVLVQVSDGYSVTEQKIWFDVGAQNRPPVFLTHYDTLEFSHADSANLSIPFQVSDPDGDSPIALTVDDSRFVLNPASVTSGQVARLERTDTTLLDEGLYVVHVTANDGHSSGGSTVESLYIRVSTEPCGPGVERPHIVASNTPQQAIQGQPFEYQVELDGSSAGVTFGLERAPEGMSIGGTGLISWTPAFDSRANEVVTVVASLSDLGDACRDTYSFSVQIDDRNAPPTADVSEIDVYANEGEYLHQSVSASDPDGDMLRYFLDQSSPVPTGMTMSINSGVVSWRVPQTAVRDYGSDLDVRVFATDTVQSSATITLHIHLTQVNVAPEFQSHPVEIAYVSSEPEPHVYQYRIQASDEDDDANCQPAVDDVSYDGLCYHLENGPSNMVLDHDDDGAFLSWTPQPGDIENSPHAVEISVSDGQSETPQTWAIDVLSLSSEVTVNHSPVISFDPEPGPFAYLDSQYAFGITLTDPDGDDIATSDVTINPTPAEFSAVDNGDDTWTVTWTPRIADFGGASVAYYTIAITASDTGGAESTGDQTIPAVNCGGDLSEFPEVLEVLSDPVTDATAGHLYVHEFDVQNHAWGLSCPGTGSVVTRQVNAPQGMNIVDIPSTSSDPSITRYRLTWNVPPDTIGPVDVDIDLTIQVNGDDRTVPYTYVLNVSAPSDDAAPEIRSIPGTKALINSEYTYTMHAYDPDHLPAELVWSATCNGGSTPAITQPTLDSPATMSWTAPAETGTYQMHVDVTDGELTDAQDYEITVVDSLADLDVGGPTISLSPTPISLAVNGLSDPATVSVQIDVDDDLPLGDNVSFAVERIYQGTTTAVAVDASPMLEDLDPADPDHPNKKTASPTFEIAPAGYGSYRCTATIIDVAGNSSTAEAVVTAFDADNECSDGSPVDCLNVAITELLDEHDNGLGTTSSVPEIKGPMKVFGTCYDLRALPTVDGESEFQRYELSYRPSGRTDLDPVVITSDYTEHTTAAELGTIDPTGMPNGAYDIILTAYTLTGDSVYTLETVIVAGDRKVGNFTVAFTDMQVPVVGIPATVTRAYDSRDRFKGDFGYGWKLGLSSMTIQESYPVGYDWEVFTSEDGFCGFQEVGAHVVSINWPDGRVESFRLRAHGTGDDGLQGAGQGGCLFYALEQPDPIEFVRISRGASKITPLGTPPQIVVAQTDNSELSQIGVMATSSYELDGTPTVWKPTGYDVETQDGTKYRFSSDYNPDDGQSSDNPLGTYHLRSITDPHGNKITFDEDGIKKGDSEYVIQFERDDEGRIYRAIDPNGNAIVYDYDANGDLVKVTDRTLNETQFVYNHSHGLVDIIDPRGVRAARNVYDDDNRLITVIDADENRTEFCRPSRNDTSVGCFEPMDVSEIDNPNDYDLSVFNVDPENTVNPPWVDYELVIDPSGLGTMHCYDESGNVVASVVVSKDPDTSVQTVERLTRTEYDEQGRETRTTDALGNVSEVVYLDADTDLVTEQHSGGHVVGGELVDYKTTRMTYNTHGQVLTTRDPLNVIEVDEQDSQGSQGDPNAESIRPSAEFYYNEYNGNLEKSWDASGRLTTNHYNSDGTLESVEGPDQRTTHFTYYPDGNVRTQTDADGNVVEFEYDANGNRILESRTVYVGDGVGDPQPVNIELRTDYDESGRAIRHYDAFGEFTVTTYNNIGKQETVTDARNNVTHYYYDNRGNIDHVVYPDQSQESYTYDVNNRQVTHTDRDGHTTKYVYDAVGNRTRTYLPDDTPSWDDNVFQETEYDAAGRTLKVYAPRTESDDPFVVTQYFYARMAFAPDPMPMNPPDLTDGIIPDDQQWVVNYVSEYVGGSGGGAPPSGSEPAKEVHAYLTVSYFDANGRLTKTQDARSFATDSGHYTEYLYDTDGHQKEVVFHDGATTSRTKVEYDDLGRKSAAVDANNKRTEYRYDDAGRLWKIINEMDGVTEYQYDRTGQKIAQIDAEGRTTTMCYDKGGRMVKRILPPADESSEAAYETWTYDEVGNQHTHTDFNGHTTEFQYDENNRLRVKLLPSNPTPFTLQLGDGSGGYMDVGHCEMVLDGDRRDLNISCTHEIPNANTVELLFYHDDGTWDIIDGEINASAASLSTTLTDEQLAIFEGGETYFLIDTPDNEGTFTSIVAPDPNPVYYAYTPSGQVTSSGAPNEPNGYGRYYNARGLVDYEFNSYGEATFYEYENAGNRTRLDSYGSEVLSVAYEYDEQNRLIRTTEDPDGDPKSTYYGYDANGNRAWVLYPNDTRAVYTYDNQNRLTDLVNEFTDGRAEPLITHYHYVLGPAGNRTRVEEYTDDGSGPIRTVDYEYDDLYRLKKEDITDDAPNQSGVITYTYDDVGNRLTKSSTISGSPALVTYEYNDRDQLILESESEIVARANLFDDGTRYARGPPRGDRDAAMYRPAYVPPTPSKWSGRILVGFVGISAVALLFPLSLLRDRRRRRRAGSGYVIESRMSRRRRIWRATISLFCLPLMLIGADKVYALEHDAALYRAMQGVAACAPRSCEGAAVCYAYTWDANGNMLTREFAEGDENSPKDIYQYDYENHLIHSDRAIDPGGPVTADYRYDPDGIRRMKTTGTKVTRYLVDRNRPYAQVLVESTSEPSDPYSPVTTTYVYGDDLISRARTAYEEYEEDGQTWHQQVTHRRYYHYDGQLSTRYLTDEGDGGATPQVTDEYTYDAFGVMLHKAGLTAAGESENAYLYTGEQYDALAGMYYLRARYYAQQQGRFVTMDPFGGYSSDPMSLHKYMYANANPVMNWDPTGRFTVLELAAVLVIVIILVAMIQTVNVSRQISQDLRNTVQVLPVHIYLNSAGLPSDFNTSAVENQMQSTVDACLGLPTAGGGSTPSKRVWISLIASASPPSEIGPVMGGPMWGTNVLEGYNNWVKWSMNSPIGAVASSDEKGNTIVFYLKAREVRDRDGGTMDNFYANILIHEVFWRNISRKYDDNTTPFGDVANGHPRPQSPRTCIPSTRSTILDALQF